MKYLYLLLIYTLFALNCENTAQKSANISLVFLRTEIPDIAMIKEIREELYFSQFTDSVKLKGEDYPVIKFDIDNDKMQKFSIEIEDVQQAIKKEIDIPMLKSIEKNEIVFRKEDLEKNYRNKSIDQLISLPIKIKESKSIVPLGAIAEIKMQLHEDLVYYQDELVYIISFKYIGKNKNELKKLLESVDKYGVDYKLVYN